MNQYLPVTITLVPAPITTVIQFVYIAVQKPPDLLKAVKPPYLWCLSQVETGLIQCNRSKSLSLPDG